MKRYIRTTNSKIYDLSKYTDLRENETSYFIRNKEYKPNSKLISKAFRYKVYFCKKDIIKESDNIFDLIQIGDLVEHTCLSLSNKSDIADVKSNDEFGISVRGIIMSNDDILKIYTKQDNNYILVWEKERGIIE